MVSTLMVTPKGSTRHEAKREIEDFSLIQASVYAGIPFVSIPLDQHLTVSIFLNYSSYANKIDCGED